MLRGGEKTGLGRDWDLESIDLRRSIGMEPFNWYRGSISALLGGILVKRLTSSSYRSASL